ncbi:MAG TPA: CHAT domain-containing protein [Rubrobacteraceae bacterium]|nr:CHAT domain-containing protein [Rubrobacteraceae bacterium]
MDISFEHEVARGLVDALLESPSREEQAALIESSGLLNPGGLDRLLEAAAQLVGSDPAKARELATLCADLAERAGSRIAIPRADYVLVQTHFINGEFDEALQRAKRAREGYLALGEDLEALRTDVGRMAVLLEQGHYTEVLQTGAAVLETLDGRGVLQAPSGEYDAVLLAALVYQNLGGCYEYMGRYDRALESYAAAEERYRALGITDRVGEISSNRGFILLSLGRGSEALAAHEAAADIFEKAGLTLSYSKALANAGEAHLRLANYAQSLDVFERARKLLRPLEALTEDCFLIRNIAGAYLDLNLYTEALAAYREAVSMLGTTGMVHDRALALWGMGSALIARLEFNEGEQTINEAAALFSEAGNAPMLSGVMLERASLMAARGEREAALEEAQKALDLVSDTDWPVQAVYAHLRLADLNLPDTGRAEAHLRAARQISDRLALPHLRYRLDERLGHVRRLQGREEEARVLLESAIEEIERLRGTVSQEAVRTSFLRDKTAAYEDLLELYLDRDDAEGRHGAFAVAERAKSRALVDLLTGVIEKAPSAADGGDEEERLRGLQADLNTVYSQILGGTGGEEGLLRLPDLRRRAVELEQKISRIRLEASANHELFSAALPTETVRERLSGDVTMLSYHVIGDEIVAFVSARGDIQTARRLGTVETMEHLLRGLEMQWDRFRAGPEFVGRHMPLLERSTLRILAALYDDLIRPVREMIEAGAPSYGPRKLVIVPHGLLHNVPFHALFDGESYMLEEFEISYAPSATVYALCQRRPPRMTGRSLVMGVPDPMIPAVADEARAVAASLPGAELLVDERATIEGLRASAARSSTLHLACHGLFRTDNPMFSSLKLHDGWLTAADVMSLDLNGALVTLSACESGRSEVFAGDEVIGLTRAFLGAGAATLAVSLWLVQDETTALLMRSWYEKIGTGRGRAAALRAAQLEIKEESPHPYYWAPFILTGHR